MDARDVMTQPATTLRDDASLEQAIALMLEHGISGLPVVDQHGQLVGMLTEGDLLRRVEVGTGEHHRSGWWDFIRGPGRNAAEYVRTHSRRVQDLMTRNPASVSEGTPLADVVELMEQRRVKRVPVLRLGEIVGVVSRSDLLRAVGAGLAGLSHARGRDDAILGRLRVELDEQPWFTARNVSIAVKDGVVTLGGIVAGEPMRAALRVAAQNTSGSVTVQDELIVVEPSNVLVAGA